MNTKMNISSHRQPHGERGQALVLIILAIVGLLGIAALAIDIGRAYAERRRAQSAVDAAALAWAYADSQVESGGMYTREDVDAAIPAYSSLLENDYEDIPDRVTIEVYNPPVTGPYGPDAGQPEDVRIEYFQVFVTTRVNPFFAHFVFRDQQNITVEAVAHAVPTRAISPGNALMATGRKQCPGIIFNGGAETLVNGGNIFSNSGGDGPSGAWPGTCYSGITTGSSGGIDVENGGVFVAGTWDGNPGYAVNPLPEAADPEDLPNVPAPDCSHLSNQSQGSEGTPLQEGIYSSITINNGAWTMEPGMYCLNGNFTVNGGSLDGDGVFIVMNGGSISFSGNADIYLKRPNDYVDGKGQRWGGMLIYMPDSNHGGVDLAGNNGSKYMGTIFAPGPRSPASQEKCNIGGANTSIGINASILCSTVGIAGNASVEIYYEEEQNYRMPPTVELAQ